MSQTVFLEIALKPDSLETAKAALKELLVATGEYPGNEGLEVIVDDADPTKVVIVEKWRSAADHDAYLVWRSSPAGANALGDHVTAAPVTRTFEPYVAL